MMDCCRYACPARVRRWRRRARGSAARPSPGRRASGTRCASSRTVSSPARHALWRLSLPSKAAPLDLPGSPLIEWGGAQRWLKSDAPATTLREAAARAGGHATLFRGGDKSMGVFQPLPEPLLQIHSKLKRTFDPQGLFNPGRLYSGF